ILGVTYDTPIVVAPVGGQRSFHEDGELATARGAKAGNHLQILSTATSTGVEDVTAARGAPIWYQLYATNKWEVAQAMVKRAENAGCLAVAVTVDRTGGRNQETLFRLRATDTRDCNNCHDRSSLQSNMRTRAMYQGLDLSGLRNTQSSTMTWEFFKRLRDTTKMKILAKGILAWEDAALAADNGLDAIIVSNHGARSEDSGRSTIDALPEIVDAVKGRIPILVDSGFRRGSDITKALCMGATAVCVGRPYIWGLGAFGQAGVERALEMLREETHAMIQQMGAPTVKDLVPAMVRRAWGGARRGRGPEGVSAKGGPPFFGYPNVYALIGIPSPLRTHFSIPAWHGGPRRRFSEEIEPCVLSARSPLPQPRSCQVSVLLSPPAPRCKAPARTTCSGCAPV